MWTRRQFLTRGCGALCGLAGGALALRAFPQQDVAAPDGDAARGMITRAARDAINQGLAYLAANQIADGSFGTYQHQGNVAITSLAGLAMMAGGHQPGRGRYGTVVSRALNFVVGLDQFPNGRAGFLHNPRAPIHGPMYGHGFATLFLAEAHGMVQNRQLRERLHATLTRAVQLIIETQNREGGWRYHPQQADADLSVTICQIMALRAARNAGISVPIQVCQIMALRAARNAGISVPIQVVNNCIRYVTDCQDIHGDGGFRYMKHGGPTGFARTAAGVVALNSAGVYKGKAVEKGLDYLIRNCRPGRGNVQNNDMLMHYYYGHYYAVQAMWIAGGRYWTEWYPAIRDELVNHQDKQLQAGGTQCCWVDRRICTHYATAMALIILQIPNNYLPIFQR
jgi:hypothetical protein